MLAEVVYHKIYGSAITKVNGFIKSIIRKLHQNKTTYGWKLLVEWKDVSVDWVPIKDLKQYNPVELAEYSMANEISDENTFGWWIKETLRH